MNQSDAYKEHKRWLCDVDITRFLNIDFDGLSKATSLQFDKGSEQKIIELLANYEADVETGAAIPCEDLRKEFRSIVNACETLEAFLQESAVRFQVAGPVLDNLVKAKACHFSSPKWIDRLRKARNLKVRISDVDVAKFLSIWRKKAQVLALEKGEKGRPPNIALKGFLRSLFELYRKSGGALEKGCYVDSVSGKYKGNFFELAHTLLAYSKHPYQPSPLGKQIENSIGKGNTPKTP